MDSNQMKPSKLDPELEEGNIEYKRYLFNLTDIRYQQLLTQLQWRLGEGDGEAIYYIGVNDDGNYFELTRDQQKESISNIKRLIKDAKSKIISFDFNKYFIRVKFRLIEKKVLKREYRIILLGDHQVGKSTLLGYLTYQLKDDGKGGLRNRIANHKHELENEMTSSLTIKSFNYKENRYIWIDTPGNDKYKKTRHFALESYYPNLVIFVNGNKVWKHKKFYQEYLKLKVYHI
jgi:elongation factor 1-alpha